jgi:hypothetical protein
MLRICPPRTVKRVSLRMISPVYDKYPPFGEVCIWGNWPQGVKTQKVRDYGRNPYKSYLSQWTRSQEPDDGKLSSPVLKERCPGVTPASTLTGRKHCTFQRSPTLPGSHAPRLPRSHAPRLPRSHAPTLPCILFCLMMPVGGTRRGGNGTIQPAGGLL